MTTEPKALEPWQQEDAARLEALFREKSSLSQMAFGHTWEIGNQSMVSQYLKGRRPLNIEAAVKFAKGLNCSIFDFSPTLAQKVQDAARVSITAPTPMAQEDAENDPRFTSIRQVSFKIAAGIAGFAVEFTEADAEEPLYLPTAWLERKGLDAYKLYATRVNGSSMIPTIGEGDVIVVDTGNTNREKDAIVAVNHEGELTVKRLKYEHRRWWLTSDNPNQKSYPPVPCAEGTYVLGRVVHLHRELG